MKLCAIASLIVTICGFPPQTASAANKEPETKSELWTQAKALVGQMTLEEKLLQLLAYRPNGVPRLGIPSLNAGETLHGVISESCTTFPQSIALGATFDPDLVKSIASVCAKEARAVGIAQAYAPMLGVARDPRWGRVEETYGEDPLLVTRMGVAYITGAQGEGAERFGKEKVITTPKHFVADGEPWAGANGEGFETSMRVLREIHMPPFEAAVKIAQTGSVMPAHHTIEGVPCHANRWLLDDVLRQEWGFSGFVTSDMGDIPKLGTGGGYGGYAFVRDDKASAVASILAGVDMELIGNLYMKELHEAVKEGLVKETVITTSATRIVAAKLELLGLVTPGKTASTGAESASENTIREYQGKDDIWAKLVADGSFNTAEGGRAAHWREIVNTPEHDTLALDAARKALVLLQNNQGLLPLSATKHRKILVVGPLANQMNIGGYSSKKPKFFITPLDGLKKHANGGLDVVYAPGCRALRNFLWGRKPEAEADSQAQSVEDARLLEAARSAAADRDVIIAVVGHTRQQLGENLDRDHLGLPGDQQELVEAMVATGKPVIVVLNGGNVFSVEWIAENVPTVVQAFYLGQSAGTALADVLYGTINPGGKMPLTTPRNVGQSPWYYNHPPLTGPINYAYAKNGPLWAFGHGLTYTQFAYSDLVIESQHSGSAARIRCTVRNAGARVGDDVPQLYIRQPFRSVVRPVKELKGFQRITLNPNEAREIVFELGREELKFWKNNGWVTESGPVRIMLGSSSAKIELEGTFDYLCD